MSNFHFYLLMAAIYISPGISSPQARTIVSVAFLTMAIIEVFK